MVSLTGKIVFLLVISFLEVKCCKKEDFQYIRITEKAQSLKNPKKFSSDFFTESLHRHEFILPVEGSSLCYQNIQKYEEYVKDAYSVNIRGHVITELRRGDVQNLEYLEILNLDENDIEVIEPGAFLNVPKLKYVQLHNNKIKEIPSGVFNNLVIRKLHLNGNNIAHIAPNAFSSMPNLTTIDLSYNKLTKIPEISFSKVQNTLETLKLSGNQIDVIHAAAFAELTKLRYLALDYNKFDCLSDDLLAAFPNELTLSVAPNKNIKCLCWNKIEEWLADHYESNKDTINFTVRHSELQCRIEFLEILTNIEKRVSALEKQSAFVQ